MKKTMPKKTKQSDTEQGYFFADDTLRIDIKYSDDAVKNETIKFTPLKGNFVEINADALLEIISKNFRTKTAALALYDAEIGLIPMQGVVRQISFEADQDYKKGDIINKKFIQKMPWALARIEEAYGIALRDGEVTAMPNDSYVKYIKQFDEENTRYVKAVYQDEIPKEPVRPDSLKE